ncbi:ABC transporter substrate-binding protein [Kiloniella laminariae]|uniref:ABC transporter substrate-binding protein n=1 Tax=Kiloniella laminariae TaxID=454162 RepID=A0ABT4LGL1_9PROT|nr:ABC transporter substrate-binding protein [Kiloniella laminariae]MCZ4280228.1 ABC transporter substrate-binding protein [Kiloniella laminariae]
MKHLRKLFVLLIIIAGSLPTQVNAKVFSFPATNQSSNNTASAPAEIIIYSSTDVDIFQGVIEDFQSTLPGISVTYHELQSLELYERIQEESNAGQKTADLAISSAMDLQMKLANDGFAQPVDLSSAQNMPSWSIWRNEAFGVTFEPSVIIYNKKYFTPQTLPRNRTELLNFLEKRPADLFGRIATYDIERSGLGYLFLAVDAEKYSATWDLVRAMGLNGVKLYSSSSAIIENVSSGKFVLGYNVLGSYALSRLESSPDLGILLPEDYTVVFSRIALIPKAAKTSSLGVIFLDYLLSEHGQRVMVETAKLNAIHPDINLPLGQMNLSDTSKNNMIPIKVGPGLLVYLDQAKRGRIIRKWNSTLRGN